MTRKQALKIMRAAEEKEMHYCWYPTKAKAAHWAKVLSLVLERDYEPWRCREYLTGKWRWWIRPKQ